MQFTDSHIHLQDYKTNSAQQIIADLQGIGFIKVVCPSSTPQDWDQVAKLATNWPEMIIPAFGVHPWHIDLASTDWAFQLKRYLEQFPSAQVGECGFDRLKAPENGQKEVFALQLELAKELKRPLNIHALKADMWLSDFWPLMPDRFMLHSFGGSTEFLQSALKAGAYISLSPALFKRKNYIDIIRMVPLDRLLLESDAPWQADYKNIPALANKAAQLKQMDITQFVAQIYANFKEFNYGK